MGDEDEDELSLSTFALPRPSPTLGERRNFPSVSEEVETAVIVQKRLSSPMKPPVIKGGMVQVGRASEVSQQDRKDTIRGRVVGLLIESSWEDREFCGLTGVEIILGDGSIAQLGKASVQGEPYGLCVLGYDDDIRTPDKIIDGVNNTTDEEHMWLFPFTQGSRHELRMDLGTTKTLKGLRVWNYNKNFESARSRGAKNVTIFVDEEYLFRCLLRVVSLSLYDSYRLTFTGSGI